MIEPGLVSVTFRKLRPDEVVTLVKRAEFRAIEWGGDVHVPHGNVATAKRVLGITRDAGLTVCSYGSYYRVGCEGDKNNPSFDAVLDTAVALEAETVRVWAGDRGSRGATDSWWSFMTQETRRLADRAAAANLTLSFEYHGNTLNDSIDGARRFFRSVEHAGVRSYWQPEIGLSVQERIRGLKLLRGRLSNLHVYHWLEGTRRPLDDGEDEWFRYLQIARDTGRRHYALIEFVQDDMPPYFLRDAETLRKLLERLEKKKP